MIVELGVNDGLRGVPVPVVKANLEKIITAAQAQKIEVVLCAMEALPLHGLAVHDCVPPDVRRPGRRPMA
jgi:acyl-CoA thioesterase-1